MCQIHIIYIIYIERFNGFNDQEIFGELENHLRNPYIETSVKKSGVIHIEYDTWCYPHKVSGIILRETPQMYLNCKNKQNKNSLKSLLDLCSGKHFSVKL